MPAGRDAGSEADSLFTLANLMRQYQACRRGKRNTVNALHFEAAQELKLLALRDDLVARSYRPGRSVCFFVRRPKLREIFAADFRDRVVHHVLVHHLERLWEPVFIHDSYACRRGRGVHAGVARLQQFMRQATANGTRQAWYLQLDVRNYFMSIDKACLFDMLRARLDERKPCDAQALWLCEQLVFHDCTEAPLFKGHRGLLDQLPPHKTLFKAAPGKGLPIGNLNSQFFANVYLNALDQFVKHELKCRWYLRYCDDFVLLAASPEQLRQWQQRIRQFLAERLMLQLNDSRQRLRPIADGADFLGYIVRPTHLLVRRRVVGHLRDRLRQWQSRWVSQQGPVTRWQFDEHGLAELQSTLASYLGHFRWAASHRLVQTILEENPWLGGFMALDVQSKTLRRRDAPLRHPGRRVAAHSLLSQYRHWCREFAGDEVWIQIGAFVERLQWPPRRLGNPAPAQAGPLRRMRATRRGAIEGFPLQQTQRRLAARAARGRPQLLVTEIEAPAAGFVSRRPAWRWAAQVDRGAPTCA